ncbi:MAG: ABC transporter permease [Planctomycetota bacterium]
MKTYLLKRLILFPVTLLGITIVAFALIRMAPGDPATLKRHGMASGAQAKAEQKRGTEDAVQKFRKRHGLDKPPVQQYFRWLGKLAKGDLGTTFFGDKPVAEEMWPHLKVSLLLQGVSLALIFLIGIPLGIYSAWRPGSLGDQVSSVILFMLYSLPSFWVATMLIVFFGNPETAPFGISFPVAGLETPGRVYASTWDHVVDIAYHAVLPILCLSYATLAMVSRYMRTGMLEVIRQDYVRTARAKGLSEGRIIMKHVFRNGLFPIITLAAAMLPVIVGGSIIIEVIFNVPGMGWWAIDAINRREYDILMATFLLSGVATLVGILISDLLYAVLDPRVSYDSEPGA